MPIVIVYDVVVKRHTDEPAVFTLTHKGFSLNDKAVMKWIEKNLVKIEAGDSIVIKVKTMKVLDI